MQCFCRWFCCALHGSWRRLRQAEDLRREERHRVEVQRLRGKHRRRHRLQVVKLLHRLVIRRRRRRAAPRNHPRIQTGRLPEQRRIQRPTLRAPTRIPELRRIQAHPIRVRRTPERTQKRATRDRIRTLRIPAQTPELRRRPDLRIEQGDKSKRTLLMRKKLNVDRSDEKGGPE
jgi:hypothetical protein